MATQIATTQAHTFYREVFKLVIFFQRCREVLGFFWLCCLRRLRFGSALGGGLTRHGGCVL